MTARRLASLAALVAMLGVAHSPYAPTQTALPTPAMSNPWTLLMRKAAAHAAKHGALVPILSPNDHTVAPAAFGLPATTPAVDVPSLRRAGVRVEPWTTNDPAQMRAVLATGVDGLISDRPDLLQAIVAEQRAAHPDDARLRHLTTSAHRGGRGLRPENTLPSFESGLDQLATELETDTGVSTDHVSLIWHDQFYNPQSCRRTDGTPYTLANRVYLRDISAHDAQHMFICDKLHFGPAQRNDLALSPVAVAFAKAEGMPHPYAPTYVAQLFRFVAFYADFYTTGAGRWTPHAAERAANARTVHFNLETKILPEHIPLEGTGKQDPNAPPGLYVNHTVSPQVFVDTLAGVIMAHGMAERSIIQSFDFRTLQLVEEQFPHIVTSYLTENPELLSTDFVPASLRLP